MELFQIYYSLSHTVSKMCLNQRIQFEDCISTRVRDACHLRLGLDPQVNGLVSLAAGVAYTGPLLISLIGFHLNAAQGCDHRGYIQ